MKYKSSFGERLKELRQEKGLSQEQLAKQVNCCSHAAIGFWESNKRIPNLNSVIALAEFFDVTVGYIAGTED